MNTGFKALILHPMQAFKVIVLVIMISIPLVSVTLTDYMSYNSFIPTLRDADLEMSLKPSVESTFQMTEVTQSSLMAVEECNNSELIYEDLLPATVTSDGTTIATDILMIGLSNLTLISGETQTQSIAILMEDAENLGLSLGDSLNVSGVTNQTLRIGGFTDVSENQLERIEHIISAFGRPESYLMIFGYIGQIRNLTLQSGREIDSNAVSNYIHIICNLVLPYIYVSNPSSLSSKLTESISEVALALEEFGEVESIWTPLDQWNHIKTNYVELNANVNLIVWPAFIVSLLFLYLALQIMTVLRRRDFAIMTVRGTSQSQLNRFMLSADLVIAFIGGILSIPFGVLLIFLLVGNSSIVNSIDWLWFVLQDPISLILRILVLSFVVIFASSLTSFRYLRNFQITELLSKETPYEKVTHRRNLMLIGIAVSIGILIDSILNYPALTTIIKMGQESPSLSTIARLSMYLELLLLILSPVVIGYSVSMLVSNWQPKAWNTLGKIRRRSSSRISLLAKCFVMPHKRAESISALIIISVFLSNFLGVFYGTQMQLNDSRQTLLVGGSLRVEIRGENVSIDSIASNLSNLEGVQVLSVCSMSRISVRGEDLFFREGPLYIVDDEYFNSSSMRANQLQDFVIPNRTILASQGFSEYVKTGDIVTVGWDFENRSEAEIGGIFQFIPGFQESVFQYQESGSTGWAFFATKSGIEQITPYFKSENYYLFIDTILDSKELRSSIQFLLDVLLESQIDVLYDIEIASNSMSVQAIENGYLVILETYLVIIGTISISMVITLSLREKRKEMLVTRARGASGKMILGSLILYYFSLLLPLLFIGIVLSVIYTYALSIAPSMIPIEFQIQGGKLTMPYGYSVSVPFSVLVTNVMLLAITTTIIIFSTFHIWKTRRMIMEMS